MATPDVTESDIGTPANIGEAILPFLPLPSWRSAIQSLQQSPNQPVVLSLTMVTFRRHCNSPINRRTIWSQPLGVLLTAARVNTD